MNKIAFIFISFCFYSNTLFGQYTEQIREFKVNEYPVNAVAVSPDCKYVAAGGGKGTYGEIVIWALETGEVYRRYYNYVYFVVDFLQFSRDSNLLFAGGEDGAMEISFKNVAEKKDIYKKNEINIQSLDLNPQGNLLAIYEKYNGLYLLDKSTQGIHEKGAFGHISRKVREIKLSQDGKLIACSGFDSRDSSEVIIWDVQHQGSKKLFSSSSGINSIDISPDANLLIAGTESGALIGWNFQTQELFNLLPQNLNYPIYKVKCTQDGNFVVFCGKSDLISVLELSSFKIVRQYKGSNKDIRSLAFDEKEKYMISYDKNNTIRFWPGIPLQMKIESYVNRKIKEWQKRDRYENTQDYQARVNIAHRELKIRQYTQEAIDAMAKLQYDWSIKKSDYDPDHETFRLTFNNFDTLYINVPAAEASSFDQNLNSLKFKNVHFTLTENEEFVLMQLEIENPVNGKTYTYQTDHFLTFDPNRLNLDLGEIQLDVPNFTQPQTQNPTNSKPTLVKSEVDENLPQTRMDNPDAVAVVIGNANYEKVQPVSFAIKDAQSIRKYLIEVMGFKPGNIIYMENASYGDFKLVFGSKGNPQGKLYNTLKPGKSEVFVFYSGHGAPGLKDQQAYFVPYECDPQYVELTGFPMDVFYDNMAQLPAASVTVVLDACFSGENIYKNISPIVIKSKGALGLKNGALLASSEAGQVSSWYNEKAHGLFTYFFLKAIHDKNADANADNQLTLEEIHTYISDLSEGVPYQARRLHGVEQIPVIKGQNPNKVLVNYN